MGSYICHTPGRKVFFFQFVEKDTEKDISPFPNVKIIKVMPGGLLLSLTEFFRWLSFSHGYHSALKVFFPLCFLRCLSQLLLQSFSSDAQHPTDNHNISAAIPGGVRARFTNRLYLRLVKILAIPWIIFSNIFSGYFAAVPLAKTLVS